MPKGLGWRVHQVHWQGQHQRTSSWPECCGVLQQHGEMGASSGQHHRPVSTSWGVGSGSHSWRNCGLCCSSWKVCAVGRSVLCVVCLTVFDPTSREEGEVDVMHIDYASSEYVTADQIMVTVPEALSSFSKDFMPWPCKVVDVKPVSLNNGALFVCFCMLCGIAWLCFLPF